MIRAFCPHARALRLSHDDTEYTMPSRSGMNCGVPVSCRTIEAPQCTVPMLEAIAWGKGLA